jgi:hypothetical protein
MTADELEADHRHRARRFQPRRRPPGLVAILVGNGGYDTYQIGAGFGRVVINNAASNGASAPSGEVDFGARIQSNQLWFSQHGNDLEIDRLGRSDHLTIDGWYSADASSQIASFNISDGLRLDSQVAQLVSAMATYSAANPAFDPTAATVHTLPNDSALQSSVAAAWHARFETPTEPIDARFCSGPGYGL